MNERNCAYFNISLEHLRDHTDEVAEAFSKLKIVPIKVDVGAFLGDYTYTALSPFFDEVPVPCKSLPCYALMVDVVPGQPRRYWFKKVKDAVSGEEVLSDGL